MYFLYYICIKYTTMSILSIFLFVQKFGIWGFVLVVVVVLLLFGGKKIPELMRGVGRGTREFKKGLNTDDEFEEDADDKVDKKK